MQHLVSILKPLPARLWHDIRTDVALRNALLLICSTGVLSASGFAFWFVSARLYSPSEIGLSSTLIAAATTLALISLLGLDNVLVRYLPNARHPHRIINTSVITTMAASAVLAVAFLLLLPLISPSLHTVLGHPLYQALFILAILLTTIDRTKDNIFIGLRSAKYVLLANTGLAVAKVALPVALVAYGAFGLFFAFVLATSVSTILSLYYLMRHFGYRFSPVADRATLRQVRKFSLGAYTSSIVSAIPLMALPIIVTNTQGAEQAAFFNLALTMAAMLFIVPNATSNSLLAESAKTPAAFRHQTFKSLQHTFAIMVPFAVVLYLFSYYLLAIFGLSYAEGAQGALQIFLLASLGLGLNSIAQTILKLHHRLLPLFWIQLIGTATMTSLCWPLAQMFGASGGAWAFLVGQYLMTILHLAVVTPLLRLPLKHQDV